jgi:protein involved in polysaccharide export with SLBB domain
MFRLISFFVVTGWISVSSVLADTPPVSSSYLLFPRDLIRFEVYGEPDLATKLRISGTGEINVPLLGAVPIAGLDLATAGKLISERYQAAKIFIRPQINLQIEEYSKKEVSVLGQVGTQGKITLSDETVSVSIVEAIAKAGGFTRIGRSEAVRVTRRTPSGEDQTFVVDVERIIHGDNKNTENFRILPDDVIFVPERLF